MHKKSDKELLIYKFKSMKKLDDLTTVIKDYINTIVENYRLVRGYDDALQCANNALGNYLKLANKVKKLKERLEKDLERKDGSEMNTSGFIDSLEKVLKE